MTVGRAIVVSLLLRLIDAAFFALFYWTFRSAFQANPAWAAGCSAVLVLTVIPKWNER